MTRDWTRLVYYQNNEKAGSGWQITLPSIPQKNFTHAADTAERDLTDQGTGHA